MKTFDAAYLRLTGWYVLIIMIISLAFSGWVYNQTTQELQIGLKYIANEPFGANIAPTAVSERLSDSRTRVLWRLVGLNLVVLVSGAGVSYWLARRTMRPIEEAVELQNRFTADASHELRTPLAAMKTEIEVGLRDKNLSKSDAQQLLKSNLEEIDRLSDLTNGLLVLTNAATPMRGQVRVDVLVRAVVKRLQPLAQAKRIALHQELTQVTITSNKQALDKIISILLDNAIKYSPEHTAITVQLGVKNGEALLKITDQGIGIKASDLPHIFNRFYRADASRSKTIVPGHGLGLAIAQKLAEELGSTITVTSAPGQGSTFTVRL